MLKSLSIIGYVGMAGGIIALIATGNLLSASPLVIAVQVGAGVLLVWARLVFRRRIFHLAANPTEGGLVSSGPYRYIRHPIYTAVIVFSGAGVAAHWSWGRVSGRVGGGLRVAASFL
jgi:protein-S-isoprenylcysteine O-methyltransferase Ste14